MQSETERKLVDKLLRYRAITILLALGFVGFSGIGLGDLKVNPNNRVFFSLTNQYFAELLDFESTFESNTNVTFSISADSDLFEDPSFVKAARWLEGESWRIDGVTRVDSLGSYPRGEYHDDEISLSTVLDHLCPKDVCSRAISAEVIRPNHIGRFVSADFRTLAIVATVEFDIADLVAVSRINNQTKALVEAFRLEYPDYQINYSGAVPMMQAFVDASNKDLSLLVPVATVVFFVLLWTFLGSIGIAALMIAIGLMSIAATLGIAGWFGYVLNTATSTVPLVIFTLVIAASMHVFLYVSREESRNNSEVRRCVRQAILANVSPVLLAAVTSIVGLLSLVFVASPPIKELGLLSALGVAIGTFLLLTFAPATLSYFRVIRPSKTVIAIQRGLNGQARKIENGEDRPSFSVVFFISCLFGLPFLVIDEDFVRYFDAADPFRVNTEEMTERLSGPYHAEIVIDTGAAGGIFAPQTISLTKQIEDLLSVDPIVVNVFSMVDILEEAAKVFNEQVRLDQLSQEALAQYFLSFELALTKGQSIADFVDVDQSKMRISVLFGDASMAEIRAFEARISTWVRANVDTNFQVRVTGEGVPTAHLSGDSISEMSLGIFFSLLFSTFLLGAFYRKTKIALAAMLAISIPVLAGFGIWGAIVGEIGMAATMVVAVTIGVVIDDSIHLLFRYRDGHTNYDLSNLGAAAYSLHRTGAAVVATSIVLAGGFGVLMLSGFRMNSTFGVCSVLVIVLALVYNILLMPRVMAWSGR